MMSEKFSFSKKDDGMIKTQNTTKNKEGCMISQVVDSTGERTCVMDSCVRSKRRCDSRADIDIGDTPEYVYITEVDDGR